MLHYVYPALLGYSQSSAGGTLVSHGEISVGDLTSLLLYTVYVGSGLQMLTYVAYVVHILLAHRRQSDHSL